MAPTTRACLDRLRQAIHAPVALCQTEQIEHLGRLGFLLDGTQVSFSLYRHVEEDGMCSLRVAPTRPRHDPSVPYEFTSAVNIDYFPGDTWVTGGGISRDAPHTITPPLGVRALDTLVAISTLLTHTFFGGDNAHYALTDAARLPTRTGRALFNSEDDTRPFLTEVKVMQGNTTTYGRYGFFGVRTGTPSKCAAYARMCTSTPLHVALRARMRTAEPLDVGMLTDMLTHYGDCTVAETTRTLLAEHNYEHVFVLGYYVAPIEALTPGQDVVLRWDLWHLWHAAHGSPSLFVV